MRIVLTGGPGGGKTTLIRQLLCDSGWSCRLAGLPEAILLMQGVGLSPDEPLFQRAVVRLQMAMEGALDNTFGADDPRVVVCHRGSLDPLAYWLDRGWSDDEFYAFTGTTRQEHYQRYAGVIHLVTAADGAAAHYVRWPDAHRGERPQDAIRLDGLLHHVWADHPHYYRVDNAGRDWAAKAEEAKRIILRLVDQTD